MSQVLVYAYWIWLAAAVGVIGYRAYGRATGQRAHMFEFRDRTTSDRDQRSSGSRDESPADETIAPAAAFEGTVRAPEGPDGPIDADIEPLTTSEIHPAVLAAMRTDKPADEPAGTEVAPSTSGGLFSPESRQTHRPITLGTLAPLHETLAGIEMPCNLVPVIELGPRPPREVHRERLVLMTTSAGAGEVAARVADELERLELEVSPISESSCVARRRDYAVELRIHEFPDRVIENAEAAFPMVPDGAVVVEFIAA